MSERRNGLRGEAKHRFCVRDRVRVLAAKIEFSYGAGQNLLALRLQWFESTPAQAFPKAILQVCKPFGGQLGISSPVSDTNPFPVSPERSVLVLFDDQSSID